MIVSVIVAVSENGIIGADGDLPWRLSADLKRFKNITMGHSIIMGRLTYESINRLLPGRQTIILSRNASYTVPGARVVPDLESAIKAAGEDTEVFIVGGAKIYDLALPHANRIYLTRVHATIDGDTRFPKIEWNLWELKDKKEFPADDRNEYSHSFEIYERRNQEAD